MKKDEAIQQLGLPSKFSEEEVFAAYKETYINTKNYLIEQGRTESVKFEKLKEVNNAFLTLSKKNILYKKSDTSIVLSLGIEEWNQRKNEHENFDVFSEFDLLLKKCNQLAKEKRYGLLIRLMELGIERSLKKDKYNGFKGHRKLVRKMGHFLLDIGLDEKGIELATMGATNYSIGKTYFEIKDYHAAIKYFGLALQEKNEEALNKNIVLFIAKSYFLLGEYKSCLHIIEQVLPDIQQKEGKDIILSEQMSKMLLLAISKVQNLSKGVLSKFKVKLKYPMAFKYISRYLESFKGAVKYLDKINEPESFEQFKGSLESNFELVREPNMKYAEQELNDIHYEIFDEPVNNSLIFGRQ